MIAKSLPRQKWKRVPGESLEVRRSWFTRGSKSFSTVAEADEWGVMRDGSSSRFNPVS